MFADSINDWKNEFRNSQGGLVHKDLAVRTVAQVSSKHRTNYTAIMKIPCFLWLATAFLLISEIQAEIDLTITDAECDILKPDVLKECSVVVGQTADGATCLSTTLVLNEPLDKTSKVSISIRKLSPAGECKVDTGIDMEEFIFRFQKRDNKFANMVMDALDFGSDSPVPPGEYKGICFIPPKDLIPENYPPGDYCVVVDLKTGLVTVATIRVYEELKQIN